MVKIALIVLLSFIMGSAVAQQPFFKELYAEKNWKDDSVLCGDILNTDTAGYVIYSSGCEANCFLFLNRYTIANDTLWVKPFDYLLENFFIDVKKTPSNGKIQTITFLGAEGDTIKHTYDSANMVTLLGGYKTKNAFFNENLQIERGKYKAIEILQLSMLFNVPSVLWLDKEYDYMVTLNVPSQMFKYKIKGVGNIENKYLVIKNNTISIDENKITLLLWKFDGKEIYLK